MVDNPFGQDVIDAVATHMNEDHADDALMIVQALGGVAEATHAHVVYLDGEGVDFAVVAGDGRRTVRVPWSQPLSERPQIRAEFVRMYHEACQLLDVTPRPAGEH